MSDGRRRMHRSSTFQSEDSLPVSVDVAVVNIGEMRVRVGDRRVLMEVHLGFLAVPLKIMRVLMVFVVPVPVPMVVVQNLVSVWMFMPLADMQPDSQSHEHACTPERMRWHRRWHDHGKHKGWYKHHGDDDEQQIIVA
jgi:hypothetical protein